MKKFNEFREDQFQSIVENLSEEDKQYLIELTGDNPGLGMGILGAAARTAKFGLYDVPKFAITKVAKPVVSKTWNAASTGKSIQNKEPWYQTAAKGLQGYYAKKTGGVKRATAGLVGQSVLPNNDKGWGPKWLPKAKESVINRFKK